MNNKIKIPILISGFVLSGTIIGGIAQVFAQNQNTNNKNVLPVQTTYTNTDKNKENTDIINKDLVKITSDEAKKIAETKTGKTFSRIEMEDENGQPVYSVTIDNKEIKINAINGLIIKTENVDNNKENNDINSDNISDNSNQKNTVDVNDSEGVDNTNDLDNINN